MRQSADLAALADLAEDDEMPDWGLRILVSLRSSGERGMEVALHGSPPVESLLGTLDVVKDHFLHMGTRPR